MFKPPQHPKSLPALHLSFMASTASLRRVAALPLLVLAAAVMLASAVGAGSASAAGLGEGAAGTLNFNMISLPLDVEASLTAASYPFTAKGLANYIGPSVTRIQRWRPDTQSWQSSNGPSFTINNFPLETGGVYMVLLNNTDVSLSSLSLVGTVPLPSLTTPQGTAGRIEYTLVGGTVCKLNTITVPLDRSDLSKAKDLALAIGNVQRIQQWRPDTQTWQSSNAPSFTINNFDTKSGYPYMICVNSAGNNLVWP